MDQRVWKNLAKRMASRGFTPANERPQLMGQFLDQPEGGVAQWTFTSVCADKPIMVWHIAGKLYVVMVRHLLRNYAHANHIIIQKDQATHNAVAEMCQMAPDCFELIDEDSLCFDLLEACSGSQFEVVQQPLPYWMAKNVANFPRILVTDPLIAHFNYPVGTVICVPTECRYYIVR